MGLPCRAQTFSDPLPFRNMFALLSSTPYCNCLYVLLCAGPSVDDPLPLCAPIGVYVLHACRPCIIRRFTISMLCAGRPCVGDHGCRVQQFQLPHS